MTENHIILTLDHIAKYFDGGAGKGPVSVLRDITLTVAQGESIAIVGPSGSGKSTLLNIIGGLDRPSSGSVIFDGKDISKMPDRQLSLMRSRDIGFIFQLHHLLPQCTVFENVLIPTMARRGARKKSDKKDHERARYLLKRVGLGERMDFWPSQLSGGERQRVAVVRALINSPKILLADEPTGSLDRSLAEDLAHLLFELNKECGIILIIVTHSAMLARYMDRIYSLYDGHLTPQSKP
ncbi:MAG: ABC transporter ATP-binding protein [bacterium]